MSITESPGTSAPEPIELTGERTVPHVPHENYWFRRHEAAYLTVAGRHLWGVVLDAGCGEGYGAAMLAREAERVVAVDYDTPTTRHVAATYPGLTVLRADVCHLPLLDRSFDAVVAMQVIEHVHDQTGFVAECARLLRPGGVLVVTTPNRLTFSPGTDTPLNPFHTKELSASELARLCAGNGFDAVDIAGIRHGERLTTLDAKHGGSLIAAQLDAVFGTLPGQTTLPGELGTDVASVRASDFVVDDRDLDNSLDLLASAVRR